MGRLVLHIGTHKTATTTIQRGLDLNRDALAARGVLYPGYELIGRKRHYAHIGVVNALSNGHADMTQDQARTFFRRVAERVADYDLVVISAESFYRQLAAGQPVGGDPAVYWRRRRDYVRAIRDLAGPAEVIVAFRRQCDYAQSLYQEHVKVTRYRRRFSEFLREFWWHFDYLGQADAWRDGFDVVRAAPFHRIVEAGDPLGAFLEMIGVSADGLQRPARFNEAMPPDAIILKRMLHRGAVGKGELRRTLESVFAALPEALAPEVRGALERRRFFGSAAAMADFQATFDAANAALAARYVPTQPDNLFAAIDAEADAIFGDALEPALLMSLVRLAGEALERRSADAGGAG